MAREIISRRQFLEAAALTTASLALAGCVKDGGPSGTNGFGAVPKEPELQVRPWNLLETPKDVNLPQELLKKIDEAEAVGKIPSHHGTIAWSLISPKILERLGYSPDIVEAASGIKSFGKLMEENKYSFFVFNRHKFNSPDGYLNKNGDTSSLWVATQRPGNSFFKGAGYLMADDYAYRTMHTRTFSPEIAQQVVGRLENQVNELGPFVASGQATTEQTVLYNRSLMELQFNHERLELFARIQQLDPAQREIVEKAIKTPVILQYDLDEVQYSNNPRQLSGIVPGGELSNRDIKAIYVPGNMDPKVAAFIQELYPDTPLIVDKFMLPDGFIQRLPKDVYNAMFQGTKAFNKSIQWLPMIGLVSYAITPVGIAAAELSEASASYEEQVAQGKTNMSFTEWYAYKSDVPFQLNNIQDGFGNSLYQPVIDVWERIEEPNKWGGWNIQRNVPTDIKMVIPSGTDVVTQVAVGDKTVLGRVAAYGVGDVTEDVEFGTMQVTFKGKEKNMPVLDMRPLNNLQLVAEYNEASGLNLYDPGTTWGVQSESGAEYIGTNKPVFQFRWCDLTDQSVTVVLKPQVISLK